MNQIRNRNDLLSILLSLAITLLWLTPFCVVADWQPPDTESDVVISLKTDPMSDPEAACLAVTLARVLKMRGSNVTLFPTLDGVSLGDAHVVGSPRFKCDTPFSADPISLQENLEAFFELGGWSIHNMVVCPLCWEKRYGEETPYYGFLPSECTDPSDPLDECYAVAIMLEHADKVIDF